MIVIDEKFLVIKEINGYLVDMILINSFRSGGLLFLCHFRIIFGQSDDTWPTSSHHDGHQCYRDLNYNCKYFSIARLHNESMLKVNLIDTRSFFVIHRWCHLQLRTLFHCTTPSYTFSVSTRFTTRGLDLWPFLSAWWFWPLAFSTTTQCTGRCSSLKYENPK
jgi:hypothetical protein